MSAFCDEPPDPHADSTPTHTSATTLLGLDIVANVPDLQARNAATVFLSKSALKAESSGGYGDPGSVTRLTNTT